MPTPELLPADGDPPEDPAAEPAHAQRDQSEDADTPRTEHPVPESLPSAAPGGGNA